LFYFVGYLTYLFYLNFKYYIVAGDINIALQGRYLFPVLGPFVILFVYSFWNIKINNLIKTIILLLISVFFVYGDTVYTLKNYEEWYFPVVNLSHDKGNVGALVMGKSSPYQFFEIKKDQPDVYGLGIYASTYIKKIGSGFFLNLYGGDCKTLLDKVEIKGEIKDNKYFAVKFRNKLKSDNKYCFNITNRGSVDPITIWYSAADIPGYVVNMDYIKQQEMDLVYSLITEDYKKLFKDYTNFEISKDIILSPQPRDVVGPIYKNFVSPYQIFELNKNQRDIGGIALYVSTYTKKVKGGFSFNLYREDCTTKVDTVVINKKIGDNEYYMVKLSRILELNSKYCFNVSNENSDNPITLWYSAVDKPGYVLDKDY
jgi:hypothetical protein